MFSSRSRTNSGSSSKNESRSENGRTRTNTSSTSEPDIPNITRSEASPPNYDFDKYEMLPSGKLIKKQVSDVDTSSNANQKAKDRMSFIIPKKLRFTLKDEDKNDEDIRAIIEQRMQDLE